MLMGVFLIAFIKFWTNCTSNLVASIPARLTDILFKLLTSNAGWNFHHGQVGGHLFGRVVVFSFARSTFRTETVTEAPDGSWTEWLQLDWSVAFAVAQAFVVQPTINEAVEKAETVAFLQKDAAWGAGKAVHVVHILSGPHDHFVPQDAILTAGASLYAE